MYEHLIFQAIVIVLCGFIMVPITFAAVFGGAPLAIGFVDNFVFGLILWLIVVVTILAVDIKLIKWASSVISQVIELT